MWYPSLMYGSLVSEIGHNLKIRTDHDRILNNKDPMHHVRSSMTGSISRIKTLQSQSGGLKHLSAAFIRIDSDQGRFLRLGMHIGLHQSTRYITEYPKSQSPDMDPEWRLTGNNKPVGWRWLPCVGRVSSFLVGLKSLNSSCCMLPVCLFSHICRLKLSSTLI